MEGHVQVHLGTNVKIPPTGSSVKKLQDWANSVMDGYQVPPLLTDTAKFQLSYNSPVAHYQLHVADSQLSTSL